MLEAGIALLPWSLLTAVDVEALDGGPGAGGGGLASLRVERSGEGILLGEARAEELQVIGAHSTSIHPQPQRFVADELRGADCLVNRRLLGTGEAQLVLVDEHATPPVVSSGLPMGSFLSHSKDGWTIAVRTVVRQAGAIHPRHE